MKGEDAGIRGNVHHKAMQRELKKGVYGGEEV